MELQTRSEWRRNASKLLTIDTLVVVKDDNSPPLRWSLGRVIAVHPEPDGLIRVATVRTSTDIFKRPVNKLYLLPIEVVNSDDGASKEPLQVE